MDLQGFGRFCNDLHGFVWFHGFVKICKNALLFARTRNCYDLWRFARTSEDLQGFAWICKDSQGLVRISRDL